MYGIIFIYSQRKYTINETLVASAARIVYKLDQTIIHNVCGLKYSLSYSLQWGSYTGSFKRIKPYGLNEQNGPAMDWKGQMTS